MWLLFGEIRPLFIPSSGHTDHDGGSPVIKYVLTDTPIDGNIMFHTLMVLQLLLKTI